MAGDIGNVENVLSDIRQVLATTVENGKIDELRGQVETASSTLAGVAQQIKIGSLLKNEMVRLIDRKIEEKSVGEKGAALVAALNTFKQQIEKLPSDERLGDKVAATELYQR